ncbi:hypothetical protein MJG53_019636, partial [Ovis ammon polii x Ovis aries]
NIPMELDKVGWRRSKKLCTDNLDQGSKTLETCKNIGGLLKPQGPGTEHINEMGDADSDKGKANRGWEIYQGQIF